MKNTGIPYEKLTQEIFQEILSHDSIDTVRIEQNVILQGKTVEHQIDVYWEFIIGGITYRTVVQAKDWNSAVSQGELLKFKAVIDDLPNQPRGVFVTRKGYQFGAKEFAKANGIILYELREPSEEDWEGKMRRLNMNFSMAIPDTETTIVPDYEWIKEERQRLKIEENEEVQIVIQGTTDNIKLYDEYGHVKGTIQSTVNKLIPLGGE